MLLLLLPRHLLLLICKLLILLLLLWSWGRICKLLIRRLILRHGHLDHRHLLGRVHGVLVRAAAAAERCAARLG